MPVISDHNVDLISKLHILLGIDIIIHTKRYEFEYIKVYLSSYLNLERLIIILNYIGSKQPILSFIYF